MDEAESEDIMESLGTWIHSLLSGMNGEEKVRVCWKDYERSGDNSRER